MATHKIDNRSKEAMQLVEYKIYMDRNFSILPHGSQNTSWEQEYTMKHTNAVEWNAK